MHPTDLKGVSFLFGRWKSKQPALSIQRQPKGHDLAVYRPSNIIAFAYLSSDLGKKKVTWERKGYNIIAKHNKYHWPLKIQAEEKADSRRSLAPDESIAEENNTILPSFRGSGPRAPSIADATDSRRPWTFCFAFQKPHRVGESIFTSSVSLPALSSLRVLLLRIPAAHLHVWACLPHLYLIDRASQKMGLQDKVTQWMEKVRLSHLLRRKLLCQRWSFGLFFVTESRSSQRGWRM